MSGLWIAYRNCSRISELRKKHSLTEIVEDTADLDGLYVELSKRRGVLLDEDVNLLRSRILMLTLCNFLSLLESMPKNQ